MAVEDDEKATPKYSFEIADLDEDEDVDGEILFFLFFLFYLFIYLFIYKVESLQSDTLTVAFKWTTVLGAPVRSTPFKLIFWKRIFGLYITIFI